MKNGMCECGCGKAKSDCTCDAGCDCKNAMTGLHESMGDITPKEWAVMEKEKAEWRKKNVAKFEGFLESLKGTRQDGLLESIKEGFGVCMEAVSSDIKES